MKRGYYRGLYLIAALYDIILGFGFLFLYKFIYEMWNMNLPENPAYLSFCAILIGLFGIVFLIIYSDIEHSRKLVIYVTIVKFAFVGVVLYYWLFMGPEYVDVPFRIFAGLDFIFALLFIESLRYIKK